MDHLADQSLPHSRGRFHSTTSNPHKLIGGFLFGLAGAVVGGAAGGLIGGHAEISLGILIGAGLGSITGVTVGDSARHGGEETYHSSPEELLGYLVVDRDGHRIGSVVSVYVDEHEQPRYLGVSTVWIPTSYAHLVPIAAVQLAADHRRVRVPTVGDVIRSAPSCRLDGALDPGLEESLRQHYEPHGIAISDSKPISTLRVRSRDRDVMPEMAGEEELGDVAIANIGYSGDAPYRSGPNIRPSGRSISGRPDPASPSGRRSAALQRALSTDASPRD